MKFLFGALATSVIAGAVAGAIFQDALFSTYLLVLAGLALAVPLALLFGLIVLIALFFKKPVSKPLLMTLVIAISIVPALLTCEETGAWINTWKVDAVENYVTRAVPILDQMKSKDGIYPVHLPVDVLGNPPELLRDDGSYSCDGKMFRFEYEDEPAGWAGGPSPLEFDSTTRVWRDEASP